MAYNIKEIIDIAIGLEEAGREFYEECGLFFKDTGIVDIFAFLAREEQIHKELFQSFQWHGEFPDSGIFNDEYFSFLRAVGGGLIFDSKVITIREILRGIGTPLEAIKHAFIAEKDSILLYTEIKRSYPVHHAASEMLERIIAEERKHVLTLYDLADKIKKT